MYLYDSIQESQHEKIGRWGKKVICKTRKTLFHFKCDNCGQEFTRPKNGKTTISGDTHFCKMCPVHSLAAKLSLKKQRKKAEIRGQKFDRGYKEIWVGPDYPYRKTTWLREHIAVMERHIEKRIPKGMVVHHIDGSKTNNQLDNLLLCTVEQHNNCHAKIERLVFELYNQGLVGFDKDKMEYFFKGSPY